MCGVSNLFITVKRFMMILIAVLILSCASSRKTAGVRIHDKTKVYQESKRMTEGQKIVFVMSIFILMGLILSALDHKQEV